MINAISPADIAYIMSSSTSARLLSPSRSVLLRNKMAERFASVSEDELCEKCTIKQLLNSVFAWYHELSKPRVCSICLSLRLWQITDLGFDNSWYHAQPRPITAYYRLVFLSICRLRKFASVLSFQTRPCFQLVFPWVSKPIHLTRIRCSGWLRA